MNSAARPRRGLRIWSLSGRLRLALLATAAVLPMGKAQALEGSFRTFIAGGNTIRAPEDNAQFLAFSEPVVNNAREVAFVSAVGSAPGFRIYRSDGTTLTPLLRNGEIPVGGTEPFAFNFDTTVNRMGDPAFNRRGQVALRGNLGSRPNLDQAIVRTDGATFTKIVREGDPVPGGGSFYASLMITVALNSRGQVLFEAGNLQGTTEGIDNDVGVFLGDGVSITEIAREGDAIPDGTDVFTNFASGSLNNSGQVAFAADLTGAGYNRGVYRGDGTTMVQIARAGQPAPEGNGLLNFPWDVVLNDAGQVAFWSEISNVLGGSSIADGIYRGDGVTLEKIVRSGDIISDGIGIFDGFSDPAFNDVGQVMFLAGIDGAGASDNGFFISDGVTTKTVVRKGQAAPGGGVFSFFRQEAAFNNLGQVVFFAELTGSPGGAADDTGIFFYDGEGGIHKIAKEGDGVPGTRLGEITFGPTFGLLGNERSGLNDLGQVAFRSVLNNGREAVILWTPVPEPASAAVAAIAALVVPWRRWRSRV